MWPAHTAVLALAALHLTATTAGAETSLRFFGTGSGGIDRVVIPIDAPETPADIGSGDFTIEWWMKAIPGENASSNVRRNSKDGWITGNILIDRDVGADADHGDYGISLNGGRIAFGVNRGAEGNTICGATDVADNRWHHVAVTRNGATGALAIFVNGRRDGEGPGPAGDVSYRDNRDMRYPNDPTLVFGAEKHDIGSSWPSYSGSLSEVRLSTVIRYTADFPPPAERFVADAATAAVYTLSAANEGPCEGAVADTSSTAASPGTCRFGGSVNQGPLFVADTPFK